MKQNDIEIILGIDPGTLVMGYGLIAVSKNTITLVEMGVLQLARKDHHAERLQMIYQKLETLIRLHRPMAVAIEAPFFGKNVQSMLKLGRAQGVAIAAAMMNGLRTTEYAPRKIKQAITGRGNASKEQVWEMLQRTLKFEEGPQFMDASDAVAVALCHHYECRLPELRSVTVVKKKNSHSGDWKQFLSDHPKRVIK